MAQIGVRSGAGLLLQRDTSSSAHHAAEMLGTLRGLAAKVGQMASYVDGLVPEAHAATYEQAMKALRAQTPSSSPAAIRSLVEEELGAPIDKLFAAWDDVPFASASIGQVHRATMPDGTVVAVKVQHPGIGHAVESDLANASIIESLAGAWGGKRFDTKAILDVIKTRFREELDYAHEANNLLFFARVHQGDPRIVIPRLVPERSKARVLTTEFLEGAHFDEACDAEQSARRAWAETLWRFVFKGNLVGGRFNADPHPGNYIFMPDGRVGFVDYGCVQAIAPPRLSVARCIHRAALARDYPRFCAEVSKMVNARPGPLEKMAHEYTRRCFNPIFNAPYRVTRRYAADLLTEMKEMGKAARKVDRHEFFTMPAEMVFINRLQFGFYSVLARLDVEVDYAAVERGFLPSEDDGPMAVQTDSDHS